VWLNLRGALTLGAFVNALQSLLLQLEIYECCDKVYRDYRTYRFPILVQVGLALGRNPFLGEVEEHTADTQSSCKPQALKERSAHPIENVYSKNHIPYACPA